MQILSIRMNKINVQLPLQPKGRGLRAGRCGMNYQFPYIMTYKFTTKVITWVYSLVHGLFFFFLKVTHA